MKFYEKVASELHEVWRKTRLTENGSYEPRWKTIKDEVYITNLNTNNLPCTVRLNEKGAYEMDIANTDYFNLSPDWQYENKEAALVVSQIIESGAVLSRNEIGEVIHNEWLKRNSWAVNDPILGLPFEELPKDEQDKDLQQYDVANRLYEKEYNIYL